MGRIVQLSDARARLFLVALGWLVFTCSTERWMEWGDPIRFHYATDELQYEAIARAAPSLPDVLISAAASERVVAHWSVGVLADSTGLGLHTVYRIVAAALLLAIAAVVVELCLAFRLPEWLAVLALGLVLTSPYTVRLLLIAPAMLSDALFVLGVSVALLGLAQARPWLAVAGCVLAVLGREMGLAVAVGVCAWLVVQRRLVPAVFALAAPVAAFAGAKLLGETFAKPNPSVSSLTIVSPLQRLPGTAGLLADHIGRVVIGAPVALAVLLAALFALARRHRLPVRQDPLTAALLIAVLILLQVVAFNPDWVQHNEPRLAALAIVPLAMAAAAAAARTGLQLSRPATVCVASAIALASLHHRFTYSGLLVPGRGFVTVEALVAAALAVFLLVSSSRAAP